MESLVNIIKFPGSNGKTGKCPPSKEFLRCELIENKFISSQIYRLGFSWQGPSPGAGQFFMIKPERTRVFLGRPISVAAWHQSKKIIEFLIMMRGTGTIDIANMYKGEYADISGPLGNTWSSFLSAYSESGRIALIGGGIGLAPLQALADEIPEHSFDFYAGFKTGFVNKDDRCAMLGTTVSFRSNNRKEAAGLIIATEDGSEGYKGRIPDFLEPKRYAAVCACGPLPMLKTVAALCRKANIPCFVSMEQRMACGLGACLGCTVKTVHGNKRCCAEGPIFPAEDLCFDE